MRNDEFITWLKGFVDGIDTERQQVSGFTKSITISIDTWKKLKEELNQIDKTVNGDSQTTYTPTPVWYPNSNTTALSHHTNVTLTGTNKSLLTEDDKII